MLCTGKHTELVLTRGTGLHTIVGMTIDIAAGNCLDRFAKIITEYLVDLQTKGQLEEQMLHFAQ